MVGAAGARAADRIAPEDSETRQAAPEGQASGGTIGQAEAADTSGGDTTSAEGSS